MVNFVCKSLVIIPLAAHASVHYRYAASHYQAKSYEWLQAVVAP
jgi:hypothetical protein